MISKLIERRIMLDPSSAKAYPPDILGALQHYASRSRASNTHRTYAGQWRQFVTWCGTCRKAALPAKPATVAAYAAKRAQAGAAVASIEVMVAAIAFAHKANGQVFDRTHPVLSLVLEGIRREHAQVQRQAEPLTGELLSDVLARFGDATADRRDAALLAILYAFALRPSEAVALDWTKLGTGRGWLSMTHARADIMLLGSKTSRCEPEVVTIPVAASPRALEAIRTWIEHAGIAPGEPLIRPLTRAGGIRKARIHVASVGDIIKRAMVRHLLRTGMTSTQVPAAASLFSGHSGRVGFYVTATEAGVPAQHIAAVARHRSLAMARRYAYRADILKCAPHETPGVGV
jgi:integrase